MPATPGLASRSGRGILEVVVSEKGEVESSNLRQSVNPVYDKLILSASRNWKYQPAMRDGQPVKYLKVIQITLERK